MNIKKLMSMLVTLFLLGTSMFIAIPTSAGELYTIRGDVYIGNELASAGIEIKLSFTDGNETNITSNTGQYQIDFEGPLHEYKGGYFFVYYDGVWQTPINNKTTDEISPTQIFYNYDLYLLSVPNNPPYTPRNSIPPHNSMNVSININLSWIGGDPDQVDTVTYDVYFGTNNSPPLMVHNQSGTSYNPDIMSHNTTYYWRIIAWDNSNASASGPEWNFTTEKESNYPPVVTDIPDQYISNGSNFTSINLDDYVSDYISNIDDEIIWTYFGNTELNVSIVDRVATITHPNENWTGAEIITFRATDPDGLFDEDNATFNVSSKNYSPEVRDIPDEYNANVSTLASFNQLIVAQEDGIWVNVTKEVYPPLIHPCEPATIAINVTAEGDSAIKLPVAVMLVIDVSGSMNWQYENETGDPHPALYYVKNAANTFIDQMDLTNDTIGVTSFAKTATLNQGLTHNGTAAKNAINELTAGGATNTGEGIRIAQQELSANCPSDAFPIILLFTDGLPTAHGPNGQWCGNNCPTENNTCTDYAREQANDSKDDNTTIFSIGFTGAITNGGCDNETIAFAEWLLKDIASGEDYYYGAPNATDIEEIYLNISQSIYDVVISNLVVSDYLPSHFIITNDGGGDYSVLPNGTHKIEFTRSFLALNDSWNIDFEITTHELGDLLPTNFANSNLTYNQDNTSYTEYLPHPRYINVTSPLEIEKNAPMWINQGEQFNYSINITNIGHTTLNNVTILDPLSNKVTFNSIDSNYSGFDENNWDYINHTLNITHILLDIGDKIGFNISVTVLNAASGDIKNTVHGGYSISPNCSVKDICNSSVITMINSPPVITTEDDPTAVEDELYSVDYEATDDEGDTLTWSLDTNTTFLSIASDTGVLSGTPVNADVGSYWVNVSVDDGNGGSDFSNFILTVINVNDPPVAVDDSLSVNEDSTNNQLDILLNDFDIDGDSLTIASVTTPSNGSVSTDGSFAYYTPNPDYNGPDQFDYTITDGSDGSDTATVFVTVTSVNDPPNTPNDPNPFAGETDVDINTDLSWNCSDPEGNPLTYDVYFGMTSPPPQIANNHSNNTYDPGTMNYKTTYYWKIVAWDNYSDFNTSDIWNFTTKKKPSGPPTNQKPIADASAGSPHYGFVGEEITFNGSLSYDPDGSIISWRWDFGDGTNGTGETTTHVYSSNGTYEVTLTVTDNDGAIDEDSIDVVISKPNTPPSTPTIDGPTSGHQDTDYEYTILSIDVDNDSIQYTIDWGDGETTITEFIQNGTSTTQIHNWTNYGEYIISVKAYDGETESGTINHTILVDVYPIDDEIKGYLVDEDSEGNYDSFNNTETKEQINVEIENGTYLIDSNGDGKWDYAFNLKTGLLKYHDYLYLKYYNIYKKTPGFELISALAMIGLVLIILRRRRLKDI